MPLVQARARALDDLENILMIRTWENSLICWIVLYVSYILAKDS